jgi:ribonucleoside-diphosphate reductase alpha chain
MSRGYVVEGQSPEERIREIAENAEKILGIAGFANKFEDYLARGFYSLSTPVWANFGNERGLPVSCYNVHIEDDITEILRKHAEVGVMSKMCGGTSGYFGDIRGRGAPISGGYQSDGSVRFMELYDKVADVISQGSTRRGSFAAYLPIDHPDIEEFLKIRKNGHAIQGLSFAVCITDAWMNEMLAGDYAKQTLWGKVIRKRYETGYPYIFFTDTANNNAPQVYKDKGRKINGSNLCSEIFLSSTKDESFVCVLSSLNLLNWEEMVETDAVETMIYFLDAVNTEFVEKAKKIPFMEDAARFAENQRALGMGVLGWHSYLQSKMIAFESFEAKMLNGAIFEEIGKRADKASKDLAELLGEPPMMKGYGKRNVTTMAVAPTTSSSFILGQVSPSIEPLASNYFAKKLAKGNFTHKNPYLEKLIKEKDKDNPEVWLSILNMGGSVQHLDFLSKEEKDVFKTFSEISQKEVIIQASQRQKYIDQGQSLNLWIPPHTPPRITSQLMIDAWKLGVKSLYYQRSLNPSKEVSRKVDSDKKELKSNIAECVSCEG